MKKNSDFKILDIATSSKEQIAMMEKYSPDIILTDIMRKEANFIIDNFFPDLKG